MRLRFEPSGIDPRKPHANGSTFTKMAKRVAVVYHFFAHYREAVIRELSRDGRCTWTFCGDVQDFESDIKPATFPPGIRFLRAPVRRLRGSIIWQQKALSVAVSRDYDVLVLLGVSKYLSMWVAAVLGRLTGKRVLFWTHGWTYRPTGFLRYVRRYFYRLGHGVMTYGRWAKQLALEEGFDPKNVYVIGNSLDFAEQRRAFARISVDRPAEIRKQLFGEERTPVIGCPTRLTAVRRLDMLLDAVATLRDSGAPANVLLIGDGPERKALEAQAARLRLNVHFAGACYDEQRIGELLTSCNVTVAPGKVGLTAMHSMAFGVPVVSHGDPERQMPEYEAIIPGKTGDLFVEGSVYSLVEAIRPWIANQWVDPRTSRNCVQTIERFWSPQFQVAAIMRAVEGKPSDDLFFIREPIAGIGTTLNHAPSSGVQTAERS